MVDQLDIVTGDGPVGQFEPLSAGWKVVGGVGETPQG